MSRHDPYINKLIFSKYLIRKKIGKGSFGTVYQGINTSNNEKIALKVEKREKNDPGTLENEALRLVYLQGEGIPCVYCYGNNLVHNLLVEELLGKSLEDLFNSYGKPFSLKTVCVLGIEMIKRIQYIHSKYYIHRDIKPDNFMIGRGQNEKKIYIIDFGLAKKYYSVSKAQHIKFVTGKHLIGTARYCGRNAHRGYEQGRRDDIESIGYVLMYFLLGVLPWQGLKVKKNEDQFEKIAQKKYATSFEELTAGQPEEFLKYFKHVEKLEFESQPNYVYLIGLFQSIIDKYCADCLYDFDWKKDSLTYVSRSTSNTDNKQADVSLIVNKNTDVSGMDYSNIHEEDNDEHDNEENDEKNKNKKIIKKKEVFIGEDKTPIENNENNIDKKNTQIRRSKSMLNVRKNKKEHDHNDKHLNKKKNKKEKNKQNDKNEKLESKNNQDTERIDSNINNNDNENDKNNELNFNNNEYNINNEKQDSKKYSIKKENENVTNEEFNRQNSNNNYINNYQDNDYKNSINQNKFNYDYNEMNNYQNEQKNEENNDLDTKDKNNEEQNNNDEMFKDMSFEQEEGSKKKKRNRAGSFDDKKEKDENIICKCLIF